MGFMGAWLPLRLATPFSRKSLMADIGCLRPPACMTETNTFEEQIRALGFIQFEESVPQMTESECYVLPDCTQGIN